MKRLSSLEKIQYANILSIVIFAISLIVEIYQYGLFDIARVLNIFNFLAALFIFVNIRKVQSFIKDASMVLKKLLMTISQIEYTFRMPVNLSF
jgi:hypothetical protein